MKLSNVQGTAEELKRYVISRFEGLRLKIKAVNDEKDSEEPVLQYALIIDIANAGGISLAPELGPWLVKNIPPNYHGITGSIYFVNYSMFYSGIWALVKRIVPQYILDKISFVSPPELLDLIPSDSVPEEYGGTLKLRSDEKEKVPILSNGESLLTPRPVFDSGEQQQGRVDGFGFGFGLGLGLKHRLDPDPDPDPSPPSPIQIASSSVHPTNSNSLHPLSIPLPDLPSSSRNPQTPTLKRPTVLSRTSSKNPFFGYRFTLPLPSSTLDHIGNIYTSHLVDEHGNRVSRRRRIADLVYTLLRMYYRRWKGRVGVLVLGVLAWILWRRRGGEWVRVLGVGFGRLLGGRDGAPST